MLVRFILIANARNYICVLDKNRRLLRKKALCNLELAVCCRSEAIGADNLNNWFCNISGVTIFVSRIDQLETTGCSYEAYSNNPCRHLRNGATKFLLVLFVTSRCDCGVQTGLDIFCLRRSCYAVGLIRPCQARCGTCGNHGFIHATLTVFAWLYLACIHIWPVLRNFFSSMTNVTSVQSHLPS